MIRDRLFREVEGNVASRSPKPMDTDAYEVAGRGELQLGILIETMRREGFELSISRPRVLYQNDPVTGQRLEPIEEVVDRRGRGATRASSSQKVSERKGDLRRDAPSGGGRTRLVFHAPSRGLIGYQASS